MTVRSELSYEEYRAWCASRVPPLVDEGTHARADGWRGGDQRWPRGECSDYDLGFDDGRTPFSLRLTVAAVPEDDACPVTVRSVESKAVITPRSKGSR